MIAVRPRTSKATERSKPSGIQHTFKIVEEIVSREAAKPASIPLPTPSPRVEERIIHERIKSPKDRGTEERRVEIRAKGPVLVEETFRSKPKRWRTEWIEKTRLTM